MRSRTSTLRSAAAFVCIFIALMAAGEWLASTTAQAQAPYRMQNSVIGTAGAAGQSRHFKAAGTLGQPAPVGIGAAGGSTLFAGFWGIYRIPTDVEKTPDAYRTMLHQNFPNPFNPSTVIEYSLAQAGHVEIAVYDVHGRKVATLVDGLREPGAYREVWDGKNEKGRVVASGIYFCRLTSDDGTLIRKMVLLR